MCSRVKPHVTVARRGRIYELRFLLARSDSYRRGKEGIAMPVFLERYVLPILAGVTLLVVTAPLHLSWALRLACALAAMLLAYFCAFAVHRHNQARAATAVSLPAKQDAPKPDGLSEMAGVSATTEDGRIVVAVQPEYLMKFYRDLTSIQADKVVGVYIGKHMKIVGRLGDVDALGSEFVSASFQKPYDLNPAHLQP